MYETVYVSSQTNIINSKMCMFVCLFSSLSVQNTQFCITVKGIPPERGCHISPDKICFRSVRNERVYFNQS